MSIQKSKTQQIVGIIIRVIQSNYLMKFYLKILEKTII